jgi:hypothetical protein
VLAEAAAAAVFATAPPPLVLAEAEKKCQKKTDIHESKETIRAHRASSKATRLFLTK